MSAAANGRAAAALVAGLVDAGLRHVVLSPGSRNTPLTLAFAERDDLQVTSILDERAAGFFALGVARSSGCPVALCCTSGSAATHYLPALVEADASRVPLVVLTADRPDELQHCGAPQTMDQRQLFGTFVRWNADLPAPSPEVRPDHLVAVAAQAVQHALTLPQGPVHLNCAFRKPLWAPEAPQNEPPRPAPRWIRGTSMLDGASVDGLVESLTTAQRGVIVCGPHSADSDAFAAHVRVLAARLQWPLVVEAGSGARFGSDTPQIVSTHDVFLRGPVGEELAADCILRFGQWVTSGPLSRWLHDQPRTLLVSADGARHDPAQGAALWIDAPPTRLVEALCERLPAAQEDGGWCARWRAIEHTTRTVIEQHGRHLDWEGAVARAVICAVPDGAAIHLANSMPIREVNALCPPDGRQLTAYVSRGVNGIDGTLATTAGEAVGSGRPVTALVGDLAFLHDLGGLLMAADQPVAFVVVDNGGGGIFGFLPIAQNDRHFESLFRTPQTANLEQLCAGAGVRYTAVDTAHELPPAVRAEHERPGAGVIHIKVDPSVNHARHEALWEGVASALEGRS